MKLWQRFFLQDAQNEIDNQTSAVDELITKGQDLVSELKQGKVKAETFHHSFLGNFVLAAELNYAVNFSFFKSVL